MDVSITKSSSYVSSGTRYVLLTRPYLDKPVMRCKRVCLAMLLEERSTLRFKSKRAFATALHVHLLR